MESKFSEDLIRIFKIYRTLMEMMRDRGYSIPTEYYDFKMEEKGGLH